jgi:hypothetical protein
MVGMVTVDCQCDSLSEEDDLGTARNLRSLVQTIPGTTGNVTIAVAGIATRRRVRSEVSPSRPSSFPSPADSESNKIEEKLPQSSNSHYSSKCFLHLLVSFPIIRI